MKKVFSILLLTAMVMSLLVGCGGSKADIGDTTIKQDLGSTINIYGNGYDVIEAHIASKNVDEENMYTTAIINVKAENSAAVANAQFEIAYYYNEESKQMELDYCELNHMADISIRPITGVRKDEAIERVDEGWEHKEAIDDLDNAMSKHMFTKTTIGKYGSITETTTHTYQFDKSSLEWMLDGIHGKETIISDAQWDIEGKWICGDESGRKYDVWGQDIALHVSDMTNTTFHLVIDWPTNGGIIFDDIVEYDAYSEKITIDVEHPDDGWDSFDIEFELDSLFLLYNAGLGKKSAVFSLETEVPGPEYVTPIDTDFTYTLDEETKTATINSYIGDEQYLQIPEFIEKEYTVVEIGDEALSYNKAILIKLPETITKIGNRAFEYSDFYQINIPDSVTYIGDSAFSNCSNMRDITFPSNLQYIGEEAFSWTALTKVILPDSLKSVSPYAFYDCNYLTTVKFGSGIEKIGEKAFMSCYQLEEITIPRHIKVIGKESFTSTGLTHLTIEDGVEKIEDGAFMGTDIVTLILPDSVTYLGDQAFRGIDTLTYLKLSSGIKTIPWCCFCDASALTELYVPEGVEVIGDYAFSNMESLNKIALPKSLMQIKIDAFENCGKLTTIYYGGEEADWNKIDIHDGYGLKAIREGNKKWNTTGGLDKIEPTAEITEADITG